MIRALRSRPTGRPLDAASAVTPAPARVAALAVALGVATLLPTGTASGQVPTPQQLILRHDSLVGGRAVLEARTSMRMIGTFTLAAAGIEAPLEILKIRPDRYLFRTTLGPLGEMLQGYDGTHAWAVQPGQGPVILTGPEAVPIAEQADFFADLHDTTRFSAMETVGEADFEGKRAWEVRLTRRNGSVVHEFFDRETGLSIGGTTTVDTPTGPLRSVAVYSDYKAFGGLRLATRIVNRNPQFDIVLSIVAVEFDTLDPSAVAPPEAVQALIATLPKRDPG